MRIVLFTVFALVCFALNSILCRLALRGGEADAAGFTAVRLVSGAATLLLIGYLSSTGAGLFEGARATKIKGNWLSAAYLFAYATSFSVAYLQLTAGTGALILFGSVQLTMIVVSLVRGERPRLFDWVGLLMAVIGLVYLVLPGLASPPLSSSLLMGVAGAAWGLYTLRGRSSSDPLGDTTGNFLRTVPFAVVTVVAFLPNLQLSKDGVLLALVSGSVASGIGYTAWYAALRHHTATRAAVMQLSVPVLTALIGVIFLSEAATPRLIIASVLILGGIALTTCARRK